MRRRCVPRKGLPAGKRATQNPIRGAAPPPKRQSTCRFPFPRNTTLLDSTFFSCYSGVQAVIEPASQAMGWIREALSSSSRRERLCPGLSGHSDRASCLSAAPRPRLGPPGRRFPRSSAHRPPPWLGQLPHAPSASGRTPTGRPRTGSGTGCGCSPPPSVRGRSPLHLEGYPAVDAPLLAAILRRIENPDHHSAGKGDAVAAPFLPPEEVVCRHAARTLPMSGIPSDNLISWVCSTF